MTKIKFGTDGWRSVIADQFTFNNVAKITQATCDVIKKKTHNRLILVGYDNRFYSDRFADIAANVALSNGFKVEMTDSPISSPVMSFSVKDRKAAMGIMLTASHNPAQFNGYKLKTPDGGSAGAEMTNAIEEQLENVLQVHQDVKSLPKKVNFVPKYIAYLKKLVNPRFLSNLKKTIVFDSMYGPGGKIFEELVKGHKKIKVIRKERDPLFGKINPEPIEVNLRSLKEQIRTEQAAAGFAVDGDADRIGVMDEKGRYIPPHTVMPLILQHIFENRKLKGKVIQTVSMGYLPARVANEFKAPFEEVPVGFKYIAEKIQEGKVVFGGEESGGYGVGLWSPERDGILCTLLLLELMGKKKKLFSELVDELYKKYGASHFKRVDFSLDKNINKIEWTERIKNVLKEKIGKIHIKEVKTIDGIKIITEDDSWVLMRPSGTEPLIRTYSEGTSNAIVDELLAEANRLVHLPPPRRESKKNKDKKKARAQRRAKALI